MFSRTWKQDRLLNALTTFGAIRLISSRFAPAGNTSFHASACFSTLSRRHSRKWFARKAEPICRNQHQRMGRP